MVEVNSDDMPNQVRVSTLDSFPSTSSLGDVREVLVQSVLPYTPFVLVRSFPGMGEGNHMGNALFLFTLSLLILVRFLEVPLLIQWLSCQESVVRLES